MNADPMATRSRCGRHNIAKVKPDQNVNAIVKKWKSSRCVSLMDTSATTNIRVVLIPPFYIGSYNEQQSIIEAVP